MTNLMANQIGGLGAAKVEGGRKFAGNGFANYFDCSDQDSLNAAVEAYNGKTAILTQEVMALKPGHAVLPYALGGRKPWSCSYLADAIRGMPSRLVEKVYWKNARYPLPVECPERVRAKQLSIRVAAAVGRFYKRN